MPKPLPYKAYVQFSKRYARATGFLAIARQNQTPPGFADFRKNRETWEKYKYLVKCCEVLATFRFREHEERTRYALDLCGEAWIQMGRVSCPDMERVIDLVMAILARSKNHLTNVQY
jgi:hypothetical protein